MNTFEFDAKKEPLFTKDSLLNVCVLEDSKCSQKAEMPVKSMGFKFFYINWIGIGFGVGFKYDSEVSP